MDTHSLRDMHLFDHYVPIIAARGMEAWRIDTTTSREVGLFYGYPVSTLGGTGRLKNYIHHFQVLRQDDEYIRVGGGPSALSDKDLFEACHERAIVRQEESEITRDEMENRLQVWLNLSDEAYWAGKLPAGQKVPSPLFQVLLAANVYCDPAYDPQLDKIAIDKIRETEGVSAGDVKTNLKGAYDKYFNKLTGTLESEAKAEYEAKEIARAEKEQAAQKQLDNMVVSLQTMAADAVSEDEKVESVTTEESDSKAEYISPIGVRMASGFLDRPVVRTLSPEEERDAARELEWRNRAKKYDLAEGVKQPVYDFNKYASERNMMVPLTEENSDAANAKKDIEGLK